ncbi:hypothetical protein ACSFB8_12145 [Enterococcus faecalis]
MCLKQQLPYPDSLLAALEVSLERAAYYYIDYFLAHDIVVSHPWLEAAYEQLKQALEEATDCS